MQILKKIIIVLYIVLVVALAFVESYNSWYMIALWALLSICGGIYVIRRGVKHSVLLLHLAFLVILAGAMVTHMTQKKGTIHLREGEPMAYFLDEDDRIFRLDYEIRLDSFRVVNEPDGKSAKDYISYVTLVPSGEHESVSMNNILHIGKSRFYQSGFDEDLHGSILIINRDPWGIPITYCGYLMMGLSFLAIIVGRARKGSAAAIQYRRLLAASLLLLAITAVLFSLKDYDMPVLKTWLLPIHVSLIVSAYVMLFISVWKRELLSVAIAFLAIGIFMGAYWANISWGTYWSWDPKEVWALITMMVYAAPLHTISLPHFRSKHFYRSYMLIAFLTVLMTYLGVNYILGGMHSYGA